MIHFHCVVRMRIPCLTLSFVRSSLNRQRAQQLVLMHSRENAHGAHERLRFFTQYSSSHDVHRQVCPCLGGNLLSSENVSKMITTRTHTLTSEAHETSALTWIPPRGNNFRAPQTFKLKPLCIEGCKHELN